VKVGALLALNEHERMGACQHLKVGTQFPPNLCPLPRGEREDGIKSFGAEIKAVIQTLSKEGLCRKKEF
jgi:hypothetical protein